MMAKEQKTAAELEAMIIAELNDPSVKVSISPDSAEGWIATTAAWGELNLVVSMRAQQIAERLRTQYDLEEV